MTVDQGRADILSAAWNLQGFRLCSSRIEERRGRLAKIVTVEAETDLHLCRVCRHPAPAAFQESAPRLFRDCSLGDFETYVEVLPWRVQCCGGTRIEAFTWQDLRHRMTTRFRCRVAALSSCMAISVVAELVHLSWELVFEIDKRAIEDALKGRSPSLDGLRKIGIDEVKWKAGWKFFTVVTDLESGRVVWLGEGRREEIISAFFVQLGVARAAELEVVVSDLWRAFVNAIEKYAPSAVHALDRFHVVQWVTEAVDRVRRSAWGQARRKELKGPKWLLLRGRERLSRSDRLSLAQLAKANRRLFRAYLLKEQLREILRHRWQRFGVLTRRLDEWCREATRTRMPEFIRVAKRIHPHIPKIVAGYECSVKLGVVESVNNKIGVVRRQAYGYRDAAYYQLKIFQRCYLGTSYVSAPL